VLRIFLQAEHFQWIVMFVSHEHTLLIRLLRLEKLSHGAGRFRWWRGRARPFDEGANRQLTFMILEWQVHKLQLRNDGE